MLNIIPISMTSIAWPQYLIAAKQALGHSITTQLDTAGMKTDSLAAFIATIGNIVDPDVKPSALLADAGALLRHVSFGFLAAVDTSLLMQVMEQTSLSITSVTLPNHNTRLAVITGSLEEWRSAIINGCSVLSTYEYRAFLDVCMLHMEKHSLAPLWQFYHKETIADKTFILTRS